MIEKIGAIHHYRISQVCQVPETLGKGQTTLGENFAECYTRRRALGKQRLSKDIFAECFLSRTRRRFCRVSFFCRVFFVQHLAKRLFDECPMDGTRKPLTLGVYGISHSVSDKILWW